MGQVDIKSVTVTDTRGSQVTRSSGSQQGTPGGLPASAPVARLVRGSSTRSRRHVAYAVVISILAVMAGYKGVLPVFRSHLMQYLGIGDARFGLLLSIGSLTGLCSVLFGGQCIDRYGPRRVIRACLTGVGCAMLVLAVGGPHFLAFAVAFGLSGLFVTPLFIAISAYLAKLFPRQKRRVISLNLASTSIGGMMFPSAAEGLLQLSRRSARISFHHILHLPFLLIGVLMMGAGFIYRRRRGVTGEPAASPRHARRWHWRGLLLPRRLLLLAILVSLHGVADSTLYVWMSRFLESASFAARGTAPGFVLTGFSFAYLIARGTLSMLPERFGQRAFMVLPGLVGGGILVVMIGTRSYGLTALGYVLGGLCWSIEYPAMVSTMMRHGKKRFGAAMAFSGVLTGLLMFASMNLMGRFVQRAGDERMWQAMLVPASLFCIIGIGGLCWGAVFDRQTPPGQEPAEPAQT